MKCFIYNKYLVPKGFSGITLYPFVFTNNKNLLTDPYFINHERIHLAQQRELLIIFFYLWYLTEFALNYLKYKNKYTAYLNISFEREAYDNEHNLNYLEKRKAYSFIRYTTKKQTKKQVYK